MKTPVVPSKDVLRHLRAQSVQVFPLRQSTCAHLRTPAIRQSCRRHISNTPRHCAKKPNTLIDDLWPRHRDGYQALPPPRPHPPPPQTRAASHSSNSSWLSRIWHRRQQHLHDKHQSVPFENQSYEDASAQLFNLNRALSRSPSGADLKLRCTEFDSHGSVTLVAGEFKKSELIAKYGLQPRDLRKIDSSVLPHILVRPSAILINLLHLRVLIQSDRVLVFDAYGSTDSYTQSLFMYDLEGKLRQRSDPRSPSSANLPYEFRALEAVLISVTSGLEAEFALVRDPVTHILRALEEDIDREKLRHLLIHSKKLGTFEQKARLVRDAIDDLLNADDDLAAMYLSERKRLGEPREENDHQEIEMLLESYHKICDEIVEISGNLISNIRNTEEVVKAILDANRNQLMLLDLKFSVGTLGLAGGTLIAGLYGMNLENFIEETNWGFGAVTGVTFVLSGVICVYGMRKLRKIQKVRMWGEGLDGYTDPSHGHGQAGRMLAGGGGGGGGGRGNWRSEAMDYQKEMKQRFKNSNAGPVLWPGMEGLGMHKLAGGEMGIGNDDIKDHSRAEATGGAKHRLASEKAKTQAEKSPAAAIAMAAVSAGRRKAPADHAERMIIHDDVEPSVQRTEREMKERKELVKTTNGLVTPGAKRR